MPKETNQTEPRPSVETLIWASVYAGWVVAVTPSVDIAGTVHDEIAAVAARVADDAVDAFKRRRAAQLEPMREAVAAVADTGAAPPVA